jgi:DNA-binding transcriptional LysR family regulator
MIDRVFPYVIRAILTIGMVVLSLGSFFADLLTRYREKYPCITVDISEGAARDVIMRLRAGQIDAAFVAGLPELPDCHSRPIWTEPLVAALPACHPLAKRAGVTWADLAGETFLVRYGGTGPQVHDHIILRLAGRWPAPSILRFDVERGTLLSMVGARLRQHGCRGSDIAAADIRRGVPARHG